MHVEFSDEGRAASALTILRRSPLVVDRDRPIVWVRGVSFRSHGRRNRTGERP